MGIDQKVQKCESNVSFSSLVQEWWDNKGWGWKDKLELCCRWICAGLWGSLYFRWYATGGPQRLHHGIEMIARLNDCKVEAQSWVSRVDLVETAKQRLWGHELG